MSTPSSSGNQSIFRGSVHFRVIASRDLVFLEDGSDLETALLEIYPMTAICDEVPRELDQIFSWEGGNHIEDCESLRAIKASVHATVLVLETILSGYRLGSLVKVTAITNHEVRPVFVVANEVRQLALR